LVTRKWEHDGKAQETKVIIRPQARERPKGWLLVEAPSGERHRKDDYVDGVRRIDARVIGLVFCVASGKHAELSFLCIGYQDLGVKSTSDPAASQERETWKPRWSPYKIW
jgi:hypothetical protein